MKAKNLLNRWAEWLSTSEKLLRCLHEQTAAITLRDVPRVERLQPDLELYTETLRDIDTKAVAEAQRLAEELNARVQNLRGLVDVLDKNEGAQVQLTANKIVIASQTIREVNAKNRKLIEGEMHYINGTLTLIAKAGAEKKGPYRTRKTSSTSILVDAAA